MTPFAYFRPRDLPQLLDTLANSPQAGLLAGGTCLIDLMKQGVEAPSTIIDLNFAPDLAGVSLLPSGALRLGAMTTLSNAARAPVLRAGWPLLQEAIIDGLTPQLRDAATIAGNIMQRPRCIYFREPGFACNKRQPGTGCAARNGVHFAHAIFGGDAAGACIAVHPSDLCVALTALDAALVIAAPGAPDRRLAMTGLHRLPGDDPTRETTLRPGEVITAIDVPPQGARGGAYIKGPEAGFALAACAMLLDIRNGVIASARIVLGGVAHKPWPAARAEAALTGARPDTRALNAALTAATEGAFTDDQTAFRLNLLRAVMTESFERAVSRVRTGQ